MTTNFDFIIVGGGTAGCILANRLASTRRKPSVLLVESGGDGSDENLRNPYERFMNAFIRPELSYDYSTIPQTALDGLSLPYARGKGLGGSSAINFMIYASGPSRDFDYWANVVGDTTWSWEASKERLRRIENFHDEVPAELEGYAKPNKRNHGYSGPVDVSYPTVPEIESKMVLDAAIELGHPLNLDLNSGNPIGFGLAVGSSHKGLRTTSASANILHKNLSNLTVWTHSAVTKVLFEGKEAVGVQIDGGKRAFAKGDIILTAGAIDTPKLLLLSGVGPAQELQQKAIPVIHDLPGVGKNLQDHNGVFVIDLVTSEFSSRGAFSQDPDQVEAAREQWTKDRTGPFNHHHGTVAIGFVKDEQIYETDAFKELDNVTQDRLRDPVVPTFELATCGPLLPPDYPLEPTEGYFSDVVILMNPQSRGSITIASSDPADAPLIDFGFMDSSYDRAALTTAIRHAMQFRKTKVMSKHWKKVISAPKSESDEDIWAFIKGNLSPLWHANGSVMMGHWLDKLACVDHDLKVFGVQGLRVADLSVCPTTPSAHTQATAYLIGQTAAEKIIAEYQLD